MAHQNRTPFIFPGITTCSRSCYHATLLGFLVVIAASTRSSFALAATPNKHVVVSTGLQNLGNTCYMNAQLQCAYHIPKIRQLITTANAPTACEEEEEMDSPPSMTIGLQAIQYVFQQMEKASNDKSFPVPVNPRVLTQALGIPVYEQQDSQEFWKLLLPTLQLPSLVDLYQGSFEDYIAAVDGSGREKRREEPFLDLSLDVTSPSVMTSLQTLFGTPELLSEEEGNGWRPEKGADKVDALKGCSLHVHGLPSVLQLHLKRFQYDWQTDIMSKKNDRFKFPRVLNLSSVCTDVEDDEKKMSMYDLQSIVIHVGEYGSGHYYAYVRPDVQSKTWYRCNDNEITKVTYKEVAMDAFGGQSSSPSSKKNEGGLLRRLFGGGGSFGWGGRTSSAYMLQYARRTDIPMLWCHDDGIEE